ncbi:MAG: O-antigen ligase family protein, partial [Deltaproteobacteria bacterium]|nr:O-antigen ligase family protein [Deltaproteobacteria bacterium]
AASERGRFALLAAVALTCGIAAVITGFHTLVGATSLYGMYTPRNVSTPMVHGPLLNPNHLGGLMAIGAVLSTGLAFYHRQATQLRVLWVVTGIACVIAMAASMSRGAMVGLVIGLVVTGVMLVAGRFTPPEGGRRHTGLRNDIPIAIVVALGLGVALYVSAGNVVEQLDNTSVTELSQPNSKYAAWKSSLELLRETPVVGIGRGAVESTLTRVHEASAYATFSHLENEYLTAVVEWGVLGSLAMAIAFGWCILTAIRRWRDGPLAAAALGALAMIMFQSSVDFGIELLGLAVPVTIIAATVALVPLRETEARTSLRLRRGGLIVALFAVTLLLLLPQTRSVAEDHELISQNPTADELRESMERHPLDYLGYGQAADVASRNNGANAVQYLNHALLLHPTHPGLHRLAARMLVKARHYDQAAIEYSLAMKVEIAPRRLLEEVVKALPAADVAAAAIPTDYPRLDIMLRSLADIERQDISLKWLARVAKRPQHDLRVIDMLYELALARKDLDSAKAAAELRRSVARTTTSHLMLVKVMFQRKEYDALLADLADGATWTGRIDEKAEAWSILCDIHIEQKNWDNALKCIHRLDASGVVPQSARWSVQKRLQTITEQRTYESKMRAIEAMERELGPAPKKPPAPASTIPPPVPVPMPAPPKP